VYFTDSVDAAALVARCLEGEPAAFEPIVEAYQRVLFNVALRMLGSREDARDATQAAFVKAYEHLASYDQQRKFFTWIYRILLNECLNVRRGRRPMEPVTPHTLKTGSAGDLLEALSAEQRQQAVQAAISALPIESREVIVLRHFADLSYEEIAAATGIPVKTVKSRLFTARQRLGQALLGWRQT
jgi:RNA polymerase sigma-70 factor (ECF subfamily)